MYILELTCKHGAQMSTADMNNRPTSRLDACDMQQDFLFILCHVGKPVPSLPGNENNASATALTNSLSIYVSHDWR